MKTKPNTSERIIEVENSLSGIKDRLIKNDFEEISISFDTETTYDEFGYGFIKHTGSFTLRAVCCAMIGTEQEQNVGKHSGQRWKTQK